MGVAWLLLTLALIGGVVTGVAIVILAVAVLDAQFAAQHRRRGRGRASRA